MANKKLTQLTEKTTTLVSDDLLYIVDSVGGTSKKAKVNKLPIPNLQQVTDSGNVTTNTITSKAGNSSTSIGSSSGVELANNVGGVKSTISNANSVGDVQLNIPNKSAGNYDIATVDDLSNLPTDDQKAAMDNASLPSASNPFLTADQIIGGLPTGEIPSGYIVRMTPLVISSPTFIDVPGLSFNITLSSAVKIYSLFSFEASADGADAKIEIRTIINGETSEPLLVDFAKASNSNGSINFRTTNPQIVGNTIVKIQARKVSGNKIPSLDKGFLYSFGLQAPKGDTGFGVAAGGLTGQALVKTSGNDYDTEWKPLITTIDVNASRNLTDEDHNATLKIKTNSTITIPDTGLRTDFTCYFDTFSGITLTIALGGGVTVSGNTGLTMSGNKMAMVYKDGASNNFRLRGEI